MLYFFPDHCDYIDPKYNFKIEDHSSFHIRQRDDLYAHEVFSEPPYDGLLISKTSTDRINSSIKSRYSMSQRNRLFRHGIIEFFRLKKDRISKKLLTIGDCGAFSYIDEDYPPFSIDDLINYYQYYDFDFGISPDHVILAYRPQTDKENIRTDLDSKILSGWKDRQEITINLSREFLNRHHREKCSFIPIGVAQGWSPDSYAYSVDTLQKIGYEFIGLGGLAHLRTKYIIDCLERIDTVRKSNTKFHLFGVNRCDKLNLFKDYGIVSFDSASPLRQAFMHENRNYHTEERDWPAIRVPQVQRNLKLMRQIRNGEILLDESLQIEKRCLKLLELFDENGSNSDELLKCLCNYEKLLGQKKSYINEYREVLARKPWKDCPCEICREIGIQVILFRGAERNKRRGFHNLYIVHQKLQNSLKSGSD